MEHIDQLQLANDAVQGEAQARRYVSDLADTIINYQNNKYCKRFCFDNKYYSQCTLPKPWGNASEQAPLCEWGNASYLWMLEDLAGPKRLQTFQGKQGASLKDYFFCIANSLPFYERWKDWRFGRKVHVPTYIQAMDDKAASVFYGLRSGEAIALIAQKISYPEQQTAELAQRIIAELTKRHRLHLLDPPVTVSLSGMSTPANEDDHTSAQADVAWHDISAEDLERNQILFAGWEQLDAVEQFVIEAMVLDQQDASDVLATLQKLGLSLKEGVAPEKTDRQQLYYFRRKTIAKLAKYCQDLTDE